MSQSSHTTRGAVITGTAALFAALAPAAAWAADPLPVGIVAETTVLSVIFRVAAVLWGAVLLVIGIRRPRITLMSFYVVVALLVGLLVGGRTSYLLSIAITLAISPRLTVPTRVNGATAMALKVQIRAVTR